jgi:hypothetical protein
MVKAAANPQTIGSNPMDHLMRLAPVAISPLTNHKTVDSKFRLQDSEDFISAEGNFDAESPDDRSSPVRIESTSMVHHPP